jgi:acetoin utilization deacetylase AcuC-like enzyme
VLVFLYTSCVVAARVALRDYQEIKTVLIIDLDTHQGQGTASIFENDDSVLTFSMHGANNFPFTKENSDYDVPLADSTGDDEFLATLRMYVPGLLRRHNPDLIFYQAGVDALAEDALGRLSLTRSGLSARNQLVYNACLDAGIPLVLTLGGGYSRPIGPTVDCHVDVYTDAVRCLDDRRFQETSGVVVDRTIA